MCSAELHRHIYTEVAAKGTDAYLGCPMCQGVQNPPN